MTVDDIKEMTQEIVDFDTYSKRNGDLYWQASDLMTLLGYESMQSFRKVINKAMLVCEKLDIAIDENFRRINNNEGMADYKLSRFACYLTAMNGDIRKKQVAQVQAYFVIFTEAFLRWAEQEKAIERIYIRGEISDHERCLAGVAKEHGVEKYPFFQNAGYRGLYNMNFSDLKEYKGVPIDRSPLDFMGTVELAANLFRITQTEEKIKNEGIRGQSKLEAAAKEVGKDVRNTMYRISGTLPEDLPTEQDIMGVKKELKHTHQAMLKNDKPAKKS